MTLDAGMKLCLTILKQVMEEKLAIKNIEVVTVTPKEGFSLLPTETLDRLLAGL